MLASVIPATAGFSVPYVNGPETGTVASSHVRVESLDGICSRELTVLLVHVVGAGAGVVSDPDTEVLDAQRVLLADLSLTHQPPSLPPPRFFDAMGVWTYLVQANNLTVCLLDLPQLHQEVPEAGLGDNLIRSEDAHAVELRGGVSLGGQVAPDDLVLLKAT